MYIEKINYNSAAYQEALQLRDIILRQPLGLQFSPEDIAAEVAQDHFACYNSENQIIGCFTMVKYDEKRYKMRQVAVNSSLQQQGIGRLMLQFAQRWASEKGANCIFCHARAEAGNFYLKNGYQIIGVPFTEVGIEHYKMEICW
ncbi:MAG: GNAT family N-acetyltransferase [Chitinophagales bacterium]|nr:GNAT family N-acetyltransferase [Bacteroidota bacterium]MCB9042555.1 GNAT family N-acetyltransferase [Chitinophagales bacterium]